MTEDEIIELADKADAEADKLLNMKGEFHPNWHEVRDEIFAKLVAEKEREGCASIADDWAVGWPFPSTVIAERIRARS
jgi:hypothetical protein